MNLYGSLVTTGLIGAAAGLKIMESLNSFRSRSNSRVASMLPLLQENSIETNTGNIISIRSIGSHNAKNVIVLLHGLGTSSNSLLLLASELCEQEDTTAILPDRAGYRNSRVGSRGYYTIRESLEDTVEVLNRVIDNPETRNITLIGHSLGGYIAYLVRQELAWPVKHTYLIEPTHPQEAVRSKAKRTGVLNLSESISTNSTLMGFGAYLLKHPSDISEAFSAASNNPFMNEVQAEQVIGQTWQAMKREWKFIAPWMLNGTSTIERHQKEGTQIMISNETYDALNREAQEDLLEDYTGTPERIHRINDADHLSLVLDKRSVDTIVKFYEERKRA